MPARSGHTLASAEDGRADADGPRVALSRTRVDGERCEYAVAVPHRWDYVRGHFPQNPIVPGAALLIEIVRAALREQWPALAEPRSIRRLKFSQPVLPGDALTLTLERRAQADPVTVRFELVRDATRCASGEMRFKARADGGEP